MQILSAVERFDSTERGTDRVRCLELILAAGMFATTVFVLQFTLGSYAAEFGNDESSHYISGLFIHDYVRAGFPSPLTYLKDYHSHYPLLGFGGWGPAYYFFEAAWMLVFSTQRASAILLAGVITAATASALYAFCRHETGRFPSLFAALAFVLTPIIQQSSSAVMLDIPVTFLCFLAMASYVRYLEYDRVIHSLAFAFLAATAMLMKGNAACLALLPPLALLIGRRYDLLLKMSFWIPLPVVAVLVGPWYLLTYGRTAQGFRYEWGLSYLKTATIENSLILWSNIGPVLLFVAAIGFIAVLRLGKKAPNRLVGAAALLISVWAFQSIVPVAIQGRYLAPLLPPLFVLAAWGVHVTARSISTTENFRNRKHVTAVVSAVTVFTLAASTLPIAFTAEPKTHSGFIEAARELWLHRIPSNPAVLIATNNQDEAAAIAELAMIDPDRPSLFAVRGSRLLGGGGYNAQDYVARFQTPEEAMTELDNYNIPFVLLRSDPNPNAWAHIAQLEEARRLYPDRWELIYRSANVSPEILLYRIGGNAEKNGDRLKLIALSAPRALTQ
jgi:hypothetical protein